MKKSTNKANVKKICIVCGDEYICNSNAHKLSKFCGNISCRNRYYYEKSGGKERQREYMQRKLEKEYPNARLRCLICGRWFRQVGTHVYLIHGMTAKEYKKQFGMDVGSTTYTLVGELRDLYGVQAKENGTYKNLEKGAKNRFKKGDPRIGKYERSEETVARLKRQFEKVHERKRFKKAKASSSMAELRSDMPKK